MIAMHELQYLVTRVGAGDPTAVAELRRELEGRMVPIIRRTMRTRTGSSTLARRILAEAERVAGKPGGWSSEEREGIIPRVARRVCEAVITGLRPGASENRLAMETVRG
jgi:hypothetical protein